MEFMKKPINGDELTIRYHGATLKATCREVTEVPKRGPDAAKFSIISKTVFANGQEAFLLDGAAELSVRVERVTTMPDKRADLISFYGVFAPAELGAVVEGARQTA